MTKLTDTLLIVENNPEMQSLMVAEGRDLGLDILIATTVSEAKIFSTQNKVSLVILDRSLDDEEDGLSYIKWLNELEVQKPGILVMSFRNATDDHIQGLELGADDYIGKPFKVEELRARLKAVSRRAQFKRSPETVLFFDNLELRLESKAVLIGGEVVKLQPKSLRLLEALTERQGEWISRRAIWYQVWTEYHGLPPQDTVINNAISRLRRALAEASGPDIISEDLGYRLIANGEENSKEGLRSSALAQASPSYETIPINAFNSVSRFEIIDSSGRSYTKQDVEALQFQLQESGKTLKLFIK